MKQLTCCKSFHASLGLTFAPCAQGVSFIMMPSFNCCGLSSHVKRNVHYSSFVRERNYILLRKILDMDLILTYAAFQDCAWQNRSLGCACQSIRKSRVTSASVAVELDLALHFSPPYKLYKTGGPCFVLVKEKGLCHLCKPMYPACFTEPLFVFLLYYGKYISSSAACCVFIL